MSGAPNPQVRTLPWLLAGQRGLRYRFEDFRQALRRNDLTAIPIALGEFEKRFQEWTKAEEKALSPALRRADIPGRDPQRELRLEYVQIRELTRYLVRQIEEGIRPNDLDGFVENLDRRLRRHEGEMEKVYYPAAEKELSADEWTVLEAAWPDL